MTGGIRAARGSVVISCYPATTTTSIRASMSSLPASSSCLDAWSASAPARARVLLPDVVCCGSHTSRSTGTH